MTQKWENRLLVRVLKVLTNTSRVCLGHLPLSCNYAASATPTVSQWEWHVSDFSFKSNSKSSVSLIFAEKLEQPVSVKHFPEPWY